jgi:hypothetical protein
MRRLATIKSNLLLLMLVVLFGCETEKILFNGPYFIQFTDQSVTKKESISDIIKIEVHLAGPALAEDVSVNYSVSGSAREGIDYTINSDQDKVTIKKGEYVGYIEVKLINNANNILRSQNVIFKLLSISDSKIQIGQGTSAIGNTFTLTIQDDCILSGTYSGTQTTFDIPVEGITVTSTDCENYTLSNWNINIDAINQISPPYDMSLTFVDNGDNTLTIPEQEEDILPTDYATIKGSGIVDPITNNIRIDLTLVDLDSTVVTLKFIKN